MRRTRTILAATLLSALLSLGFVTQGSWTTQGAFTAAGQAVAGSFATVAASHADYQALSYPTVNTADTFSYSGWTQYDVTDSGDASTVGCTVLDSTGTNDITSDFGCWITSIGTQELLYFPDGVYRVATKAAGTNALFRPTYSYSRRGIIGQSRNAILRSDLDFEDGNFAFFDGDDSEHNPSTARAWNGGSGAAAGTTRITMTDTSGFSATPYASGNWVVLRADATSTQPAGCCRWISQVTNVSAGAYIDIADALPKAFTGGNAEAEPFNPASEWVVDSMTMEFADSVAAHQYGGQQMINFKFMADVVVNNVGFRNGYRQYMTFSGTAGGVTYGNADIMVKGSDFYDPQGDKATNMYAIVLAETDRPTFFDNHVEHVTGIAFGPETDNALIAFNDFRAPDAACTDVANIPSAGGGPQSGGSQDGYCDSDGSTPAFDVPCSGNFGDGGGNDCFIAESLHSSHAPTITAAAANASCNASGDPYSCCTGSGTGTCPNGYTHCNENNLDDVLGYSGDASCRGVPAGAVYGCAEWHNNSSSGVIFTRNYCEGGIWFGNNGGFINVFVHGNWFHDAPVAGTAPFDTAGSNPGNLTWRHEGTPPAGWTQNTVWSANIMDNSDGSGRGNLGSSGIGFDVYGDGMKILDNAIGGTCYYESSPSITGCTASASARPDGTNTTFSRNDLGTEVYSGGATVPSFPGSSYTSWSEVPFSVTPAGTAPFVGIETGDPSAVTPCLPAWQRFNGSC